MDIDGEGQDTGGVRKFLRGIGNYVGSIWKDPILGKNHPQNVHELPFYSPPSTLPHESDNVPRHAANYMYEQSDESGKTGYLRVIGGVGVEEEGKNKRSVGKKRRKKNI